MLRRIGALAAKSACGAWFPEYAYSREMHSDEREHESRPSWPKHLPASFSTLTALTAPFLRFAEGAR